MAVMRVEKTKNYTVMANYHLRDIRITLKAKGLLSVMLSLPPEWDFTLQGLTSISKEGVDAIRAAVNELVTAGYVIRTRHRNSAGQLCDVEYTIYEFPQNNVSSDPASEKNLRAQQPGSDSSRHPEMPALNKPMLENPILVSPTQGNPPQEKPTPENPSLLNKEEKKKEIKNTDTSNPYQSNIDPSFPDGGEEEQPFTTGKAPMLSSPGTSSEFLIDELLQMPEHRNVSELTEQQKYLSEPSAVEGLRRKLSLQELVRKVKGQIEYWDLIDRNNKEEIDNILSIMVEVLSTKCEYFTISGKKYPADLVHQRFSQINYQTVEYVLECMHKCGSDIRNIKQYLLTTLFNAPATCDSYYSAAVRRDFEFLR